MKSKKLTIIINKPAKEIFDFTLNPINTPKWIDGITKEITNETPIKKGTIYKNQSVDGRWNEYELVEYEQGATFTLSRIDSDYHVMYTFRSLGDNKTEFEYYKWLDNGELDDTISKEVLEKLKKVIEDEN